MNRDSKGRFAPFKPLPDDGSPLFGRCVRCVSFYPGCKPQYGICGGNVQAFKKIKGHKGPFLGAPEGTWFEVHKLDGCPYWKAAW